LIGGRATDKMALQIFASVARQSSCSGAKASRFGAGDGLSLWERCCVQDEGNNRIVFTRINME